jgi:tetratricopeptide (TPR) repeat protein
MASMASYTVTIAALAKASYAAYYLRRKEYMTGIEEGFEALGMLKDARKMDSTNVDAELFGGLYEYAKGDLKKRLWWILFWYPGSKERGIRILENCRKYGQVSVTASEMALAEIYIYEKKFDASRLIISRLQKAYPESRFIFWTKAKYYEARKQWAAAGDVYGALSQSYEKSPLGAYNCVVTAAAQARMLLLAGTPQTALPICNSILKRCSSHQNEKRFASLADEARKILKEAGKHGQN